MREIANEDHKRREYHDISKPIHDRLHGISDNVKRELKKNEETFVNREVYRYLVTA